MATRDAEHRSSNSAAGGAVEGNGDEPRARAAGATRPGVIARGVEQARNAVESIQLPRPDWRTFAWGLLIIIAIAFIAGNWAPLRIHFFGLYFDAPRIIVLIIAFLLGMMTAWLLEVRSKRKSAAEEEEQEEKEAAKEAAGDGESADEIDDEVEEEEGLFPEHDYTADYETDEIAFDEPDDEPASVDEDSPDEAVLPEDEQDKDTETPETDRDQAPAGY